MRIYGMSGSSSCTALTKVAALTCGYAASDVAANKVATNVGECTAGSCFCTACDSRPADRVVDGSKTTCSTSYAQSSCVAGYWEVDLGHDYEICEMDIYEGVLLNPMTVTLLDSVNTSLISVSLQTAYSHRVMCNQSVCLLVWSIVPAAVSGQIAAIMPLQWKEGVHYATARVRLDGRAFSVSTRSVRCLPAL